MIATIHRAKSLTEAVHYNEHKVTTGAARFAFSNPMLDTRIDRLRHLQRRAALNRRAKNPCIHINLNFHPQDDGNNLAQYANRYMDRIGLGNQPYLVYEHLDTPHPHLHIVTVTIDKDGFRIPVNPIINHTSRKVTKALEREYDLVRSHTDRRPGKYDFAEGVHGYNLLEEAAAPPIDYAQELKGPAMDRTLTKVLGQYCCTSLEELNALLRAYNMRADRGKPGSRIYENGGLVYKVLDENGKPHGHYIKASALPGSPTLAYLEKRFDENRPEREHAALLIRYQVDMALDEPESNLRDIEEALQARGIQLVWETTTGLVYVDHHTHWAVSAPALGEGYEAKALLERCQSERKEQIQALWREIPFTIDISQSVR